MKITIEMSGDEIPHEDYKTILRRLNAELVGEKESLKSEWQARAEAAEKELKDVHALLDSNGIAGDAYTAAQFDCHPPSLTKRTVRLLQDFKQKFRVPAKGDKLHCVKKPFCPVQPGDIVQVAEDLNVIITETKPVPHLAGITLSPQHRWGVPLSCFEPV